MKALAQFRLTIAAVLVAGVIVIATIAGDVVVALLIGFVFIVAGGAADAVLLRRKRDPQTLIEAERFTVFKATMRTVQELVNNFLTGVQLFCAECEDKAPPEAARRLESQILETSAKLKTLADLEATPEIRMANGGGINYTGKKVA